MPPRTSRNSNTGTDSHTKNSTSDVPVDARPATRSSNIGKRPGAPDVPIKRRTSKQVQADREEKERKKQEDEVKNKRGRSRLAQLEDEMAEEDVRMADERVVHPEQNSSRRPLQRTHASGDLSVFAGTKRQRRTKEREVDSEEGDGEFINTDLGLSDLASLSETDTETTSAQVKKKVKQSKPRERQAIKAERQQPARAAAVEQDQSKPDYKRQKGKLVSRSVDDHEAPLFGKKQTAAASGPRGLTGLVSNWANDVQGWDTSMKQNSTAGVFSRTLKSSAPTLASAAGNLKQGAVANGQKGSQQASIKMAVTKTRGVFSEDEDEDAERTAAVSSPIKARGVRLTHNSVVKFSSANPDSDAIDIDTPQPRPQGKHTIRNYAPEEDIIDVKSDSSSPPKVPFKRSVQHTAVKIEDHEELGGAGFGDDVKPEPETETSSKPDRWKNTHLPNGTTLRWQTVFIPTLRRYFGSLENPWTDDMVLLNTVQFIWDSVFPMTPFVVTGEGPIFFLALQRLSEWRSGFGRAALLAVEAFFKTDSTYDAITSRVEYSSYQLTDSRFAYEHPKTAIQKAGKGLFRSSLISSTLAHHYKHIDGWIVIEGLYADEESQWPIGAIGLAAGAVDRILTLWTIGGILMEGGSGVIQKALNPSTGKMSNTTYAFNEQNQSMKTTRYSRSARSLKAKHMDEVIERAKACAKLAKEVHETGVPAAEALLVEADSDDE